MEKTIEELMEAGNEKAAAFKKKVMSQAQALEDWLNAQRDKKHAFALANIPVALRPYAWVTDGILWLKAPNCTLMSCKINVHTSGRWPEEVGGQYMDFVEDVSLYSTEDFVKGGWQLSTYEPYLNDNDGWVSCLVPVRFDATDDFELALGKAAEIGDCQQAVEEHVDTLNEALSKIEPSVDVPKTVNLICPLMQMDDVWAECVKARCAFWVADANACALHALAAGRQHIYR